MRTDPEGVIVGGEEPALPLHLGRPQRRVFHSPRISNTKPDLAGEAAHDHTGKVGKSKENQMAQRGGKRLGAGRPQGRRNKATAEQKLTLEDLARSYTETALNVLVQIAQDGQSEAARVSAANAILDRGYGKPRQLEPEAASRSNNNEQGAEAMARVQAELAEFDELLNTSLSRFVSEDAQPANED